jgi:hypothetical protein
MQPAGPRGGRRSAGCTFTWMSELVRLFVNGEAMSGGSIHHAIAGAKFLGEVATAPRYRLFSVRDEFPGLFLVEQGGVSVPGELYEIEYAMVRDALLPEEPPELELTVIELAGGLGALSLHLRKSALGAPGVVDISAVGGWRSYRALLDQG